MCEEEGMKVQLCLATSLGQASAAEVVALYIRCFSLEERARALNGMRFGMGLY